MPTAWRVRALGAGILIKTDKRKMHVNVHFNWLLERIAGKRAGMKLKVLLIIKSCQMFPVLQAAIVFMVASTLPPSPNL